MVPPPSAPEVITSAAAIADASAGSEVINNDAPVNTPAAPPTPQEPLESAPSSVTAATPQSQPQEMAFAARVQPVQAVEHSALPAEMASNAAVASASKKVVTAGDDETVTATEPHAIVAAAVDRTPEQATTAPSSAPHAATPVHHTEAPAPVVQSQPKASTPVKDISLQVNQPGKERVDVRVIQQGSEVRVSVHTADSTLSSGLRQGLSELQSRLEETGYRSEMWRPASAVAAVTASPAAQASMNHSRGGEGQPQQQGGSQQESGRRNQNQSNQPRWVEEMESSLGAGEKTSGDFYGFSR